MSLPSRLNPCSGFMLKVIYKSPAPAPFSPASPSPVNFILWPLLIPAGIFIFPFSNSKNLISGKDDFIFLNLFLALLLFKDKKYFPVLECWFFQQVARQKSPRLRVGIITTRIMVDLSDLLVNMSKKSSLLKPMPLGKAANMTQPNL